MKSIEKEEKKGSDRGVPFYKNQDDLKTILYSEIEVNNEKYSAADICFICDITGSMDQHIRAIKRILIDFATNIKQIINARPRMSFIGFRDVKDEDNFQHKPFTTNPEEIVEYLENIECYGGDDTCEDLVTPLVRALSLDWRSDLIYVYLLLDAPTHGSSYHTENEGDNYPDADKQKMLEKVMYHYMKSKINVVIIKCNDSVDIMVKKMKEYYESPISKLDVIEMTLENMMKEEFAKNFLITLKTNFSDSLSNSRRRNFRMIKHKSAGSDPVDTELDMDFGTVFPGIIHTGCLTSLNFEKQGYSYTLKLEASAEHKCKISASLVGTGAFAECYSLNVEDERAYVAKLPKSCVESVEELKPDIEASLFAKFFADKFTYYLKQSKTKEEKEKSAKVIGIQVLPLVIVKNLTPQNFKRSKVFLAQKLLDGEYNKFNNNYGWKRNNKGDDDLLAQAFSHFTYEYSAGTMIVVDIQGIVNSEGKLTITDPAVHSLLYKDHFGETNHGKLGILRFFMTHECNDYCKKLYLTDPKDVEKEAVKLKEEEEQKGLSHLYKKFEVQVEEWQKKIKSFDPKFEPRLEITEVDSDDDKTVWGVDPTPYI
eukprot:TRINITY_DN9735_c0_g1_i12.p1 TRINITY_DN9735_c0_g1~~TRINITY_DN9735_c0_g1_i12.p1  ORF type:complete len:597 (-),score=179.60 TRINITY_DN9735_c0_g1_i12:140-1930(-)